jgi:hypothetical protein
VFINVVYYESIKRELKIKPIYECRCDDRLKTKTEEFTRLTYTGFLGGLEHLKIETFICCCLFDIVPDSKTFIHVYYESRK